MMHSADFTDAHRRHWEDANLLFDGVRWANADQLYGFSAECGLKAVMRLLGMPVDEQGSPRESEHRMHVQDLWRTFKSFARGRVAARHLDLLPPGSPFDDWSHHDRYAHRDHFREASVQLHREAASAVRFMVEAVLQDGER